MQIPLFPLHTVLSPGLALPLHVFEDRYRLMVRRCLDESTPFGVVLIHEGSELAPRDGGPQELAIASVGTFAEIREASRYADGRWELLTVGAGRFVIETVKTGLEPYLVAEVEPLDDALGDADSADALVRRVSRRFVDYLRLLQPRDGEATTPIDVQVEVDVPDDDEGGSDVEAFDAGLGVIGDRALRDDPVQAEDSAADERGGRVRRRWTRVGAADPRRPVAPVVPADGHPAGRAVPQAEAAGGDDGRAAAAGARPPARPGADAPPGAPGAVQPGQARARAAGQLIGEEAGTVRQG